MYQIYFNLFLPLNIPKFSKYSSLHLKNLFKSYLKRLTNLSAGNKSLLQLRLFQGQDLDLKDADFLLKDLSAFQIIEKIIASNSGFKIAQSVDSRDSYNNEVSKILNAIVRKNELIFSERGVRDLYLGWPFVQGTLLDGSLVRCPLLFFSIELEENNNYWVLKKSASAAISFNRSFLLAYSHFNKVTFTDDFLETNFEDFSTDSLSFRNELYLFLKESKLEINFNRELFENKLVPFLNYKRVELEAELKLGELKLLPQAVLGIYPQAGSFLVPDYEKMIALAAENETVESFFIAKDFSSKQDHEINTHKFTEIKEEHTFTPFSLDASQEKALKFVKSGKSLVVQGPPGTGKSQLICNLVADYIARGKKVLVVCQKKVALEVVENRLREVGLSDFSVLLHDFKNDRKAIFEQIASQIEKLEDYKKQNSQLDSIYLDRNFLKVSRDIDAITKELEQFKKALFDTKESGITIKEMYLNSTPNTVSLNLKDTFKYFKINELNAFLKRISDIYPYQKKLGGVDYCFKNRVSFGAFKASDKVIFLSFFKEIPEASDEFINTQGYLNAPLTLKHALALTDAKDDFLNFSEALSSKELSQLFHALYTHTPDFELLDAIEIEMKMLFGQGFDADLETKDQGNIIECLEEYQSIEHNFAKKYFFRLFNQKSKLLAHYLKKHILTWQTKDIDLLITLLRNGVLLSKHKSLLASKNFVAFVPKLLLEKEFDLWFANLSKAKALRRFALGYHELDAIFREKDPLEQIKRLDSLLQASNTLCSKYHVWKEYLTYDQIEQLMHHSEIAEKYRACILDDFDDLCAYDSLLANTSEAQRKILAQLFVGDLGDVKDVQEKFRNDVYIHWIDWIEDKYPILRDASTLEMAKREKHLQEAVRFKMQYSQDIVQQKVRENTYTNIAYNRLNNRVTYRDLNHQVTKKRKLWSMRRLMNDFSEEVLQLVPCWLASPEAVSAVFPLDFMFDLVVFDEASQCFAEKGIPALYRAKQFVVTGDSQQLSPYDLYQVRFEDENEEDENVLLEIDSLLDFSKHFLPEVSLTGHYRSKSIDLIQFSNQHFYKNKLKMLPSYSDFIAQSKGFDYHLVEGIWNNSTNEIEAKKVVELCLQLFINQKDKQIGVVCFNYKQQQLIYLELLAALKNKGMALPTSFFVKNIENVQGDERDIIIFSLAYAPTKGGKLQMNFGSLNQKGGANRLNVAITRAKEKNIIVSSIMPHHMHVDDAKNDGPKLLKAFLEYAYEVSKSGFVPTYPVTDFKEVTWLLKNKISKELSTKQQHYSFSTSYHFADVLVFNKNKAKLALTDDDLYYSTDGVKEAHAYLPLSLETKNWHFEKKYSRNYWIKQKTDFSL